MTQAVGQAARCWDNEPLLWNERQGAAQASLVSKKLVGFGRSILTPTKETPRLRQQASQNTCGLQVQTKLSYHDTVRIEPWNQQLLVIAYLDSVASWTESARSVANTLDLVLALLNSDLSYLTACSSPHYLELLSAAWLRQATRLSMATDSNGHICWEKGSDRLH